jgi:hypothetical protein
MEGPAGRVEDRYRVRDSLQRNGEGTGEEGGGITVRRSEVTSGQREAGSWFDSLTVWGWAGQGDSTSRPLATPGDVVSEGKGITETDIAKNKRFLTRETAAIYSFCYLGGCQRWRGRSQATGNVRWRVRVR